MTAEDTVTEATPEATEEAAAEATGEAATALAAGQTVSIVSDSGRVRACTQPGSTSQIRGFVTNGAREDGQWVRINFRKTEPGGWVSASNVQVNP